MTRPSRSEAKYLNNIVEQDHRAIKRRTRPMFGFKNFRCAGILLSGVELMHMIAKGQMKDTDKLEPSAAQQFYFTSDVSIPEHIAIGRSSRLTGTEPNFVLAGKSGAVECMVSRGTLESWFWLPGDADNAKTLKAFHDGANRIHAVAHRKLLAHPSARLELTTADFSRS